MKTDERIDLLPNNAEGYPLIYIDHDGNVLCADCAQNDIDDGIANPDELTGSVYWEGETLHCDGCNCDLESAYGVPDWDSILCLT